ncbi:Hypothetical protein CAP_0543 [Chondromyces apiculatus DSM 436]|uniref:Uncharacterized protein n=1 Tax=Chondromyces apiculatus DSM 436 TaxID=1192034 RepID=A0A017SU81_9BACT|nr:Hypothetical protein CAP_0543 [Chondromyces apiculatus DSM 436]
MASAVSSDGNTDGCRWTSEREPPSPAPDEAQEATAIG